MKGLGKCGFQKSCHFSRGQVAALFLPVPSRPFPRNTQTLPYNPRPRLVGRCSFQRRSPNRTGLSASLDNPSVANGRRRTPFPTRGSQHPRALSAPSLAQKPSHLRYGRPPSSGAPGRGGTGGAAAGAAPGAPADWGGSAWRQQVRRGPRAPTAVGPRSRSAHSPAARHSLPGPGAGHSRKGGVGGAGRPALLPWDTLTAPAAHPELRPALHQLCSQRPAAGAPGCAVATPAPHPPPPPLRPSRSGREIAEDAGRWPLAHLLGERSKLLIFIYL